MRSKAIKDKWFLIVLVSLGSLSCFFMGVAAYSRWLRKSVYTVIEKQVVSDNLQTARQFKRLVKEMGLEDIHNDRESWQRLQNVIEDIELPNNGFVCVVDSQTGLLLCHPEIRTRPELRELPLGKFPFVVDGVQSDLITHASDHASIACAGVANIDNEAQIVAVANLPNLSADVLVHQLPSGIRHTAVRVIRPIRQIGCTIAVLVSLMITVVNYFIVTRYEHHLAKLNDQLEVLVKRRTRSLMKTRNAVIFGLARLAESRDNDTGLHLERIRSYVTVLATVLASKFRVIDKAYIEDLALASSLHDIGKVGIPDAVLLKPASFTPEERQVMEKHSVLGGECLTSIQSHLGEDDFLALATEIAYHHHEKWDGSGYPNQKRGDEIPLSARIVALADVYDALTSKRPYKNAMSHEKARDIIVEGNGTHFDPDVVEAFLTTEEDFRKIAICGNNEEATLSAVAELIEELQQAQMPKEELVASL